MPSESTEVLADTVLEELGRDSRLDASRVSLSARDGSVTLRGRVRSYSEKCCAESIVRDLAGIIGIINEIEVIPQSDAGQAKPAFEAALRRRASIAVEELLVDVSGMTMAVYGQVRSCAERDELITLASRTRGIARVDDHVTVRPAETSGRMG